jgi:hypothetical protein
LPSTNSPRKKNGIEKVRVNPLYPPLLGEF